MKYVIRGSIWNLMLIFIFFGIYFILQNDFTLDPSYKKYIKPGITDILFLATTVQAGVGYSLVYPLTQTAKITMVLQQILMLSSNLMLIYLFTLR